MNKSVYGVYGTGGCGRGVISIAKFQLESLGFDLDRLVFIDDFNFNQKVNVKFISQTNMSCKISPINLIINKSNTPRKSIENHPIS